MTEDAKPASPSARQSWIEATTCPAGATMAELGEGIVGCALPDGTKHGPVTAWQEDRLRWERQYQDGQLHGRSVSYHPNGTVAFEETYRQGKRHGPFLGWHPDGKKAHEHPYQDGQRHGLFVYWYGNGNKKIQGEYRDDQPIGVHEVWFESGARKSKVVHEGQGELHSVILWRENESREYEGRHRGRYKIGRWSYYDDQDQLIRVEEYNDGGSLLKETIYQSGKIVEEKVYDRPRPPPPIQH